MKNDLPYLNGAPASTSPLNGQATESLPLFREIPGNVSDSDASSASHSGDVGAGAK